MTRHVEPKCQYRYRLSDRLKMCHEYSIRVHQRVRDFSNHMGWAWCKISMSRDYVRCSCDYCSEIARLDGRLIVYMLYRLGYIHA